MVFIRYIAVVTLSIIAGGVVEYFLYKAASSYNLIDISGGLFSGLAGKNESDNTLGLIFVTFFGMITGFFVDISGEKKQTLTKWVELAIILLYAVR